jgi:hypothetical protein
MCWVDERRAKCETGETNICGLDEGEVEVRTDSHQGERSGILLLSLLSSCGTIRCKDWREGGVLSGTYIWMEQILGCLNYRCTEPLGIIQLG